MPGKIRIIIADDHPIFRGGLRQIISADESIEIIGEADNGEKALEIIHELKPDIAVLDIDMPKKTGLDVIRELKDSNTKIIFLTMYAEEDIFDEAMDFGIKGYVLKDSAVNDIIECILSVNEDNYYISPNVSNLLVNRRNKSKNLIKKNPELGNLTKTERNILRFISENKTSKEIAEVLFLSHRTVENHRTNISNKLNLKGSHSLLKFAIENKSYLS
ncbi:MAG: response regulator transcription factor [Ignavibacteria bacterium]|nr:response regulator transcription factor [Ignavibacteria bacterium]MBK6771307.1 response regulator transcription factor [Ignavibacteria bacterium]MBK7255317.1 response regulator transcription factor [Ignavibacteria bacterium]MBK7446189.1 response regulator transcription factor [Ignavibacteria bacterium]